MALNDLLVHIGADISGLDNALKKAGAGLATFAKASAAAAVAVGGSLAAMTLSGLKLGNEIEILARRANATPEAFQRMAAGARRAGIDSDGLSDILQDVNDKIGDFMATGAGGMADFFENIAPRVGVTANMFKKLSGPQALQLYVSSLEKAGLNQQEMTFYMEALASETTSLLPLLRNGGVAMQQFGDEAQSAGQILSTDVLQSLKNADAAISRMGNVFITLRNQLAVEMAPILEKVANQFNELAQSDEVQGAISRLAVAFGEFAEAVLSDDFLQVAIDGLTGLAKIASVAAEGMVTIANNVEIVTIAFSGLAIILAGLSAPITAVGAALLVALGGIAAWRRKAEDAATGSDTMKEALEGADQAQRNLNAALDTFSTTGAPNAGDEAIRLAGDNLRLAESALAAAEAELAKKAALEESLQAQNDAIAAERQRLADVNANVGEGEFLTLGTANMLEAEAEETAIQLQDIVTRYSAAADAVEAARARLLSTQEIVAGTGLPSGGPSTLPTLRRPGRRPSGATRPFSREEARFDEYFGPADPEKPSAGLSTAEKLREQLEQRLEVLTQGLLTERETVDMWYAEGMALLDEALKAEIIKQAEYNEQKERLEEEHQKRLTDIAKAGLEERNASMQRYMGAAASLLKSFASMQDGEGKKSFEKQKQLRKAAAIIEGIGAGVAAWRSGMEQGGLPLAITYAAVSAAKTAAQISAINRQSYSGGSSGAASASTGASSSAASAPALPTQTVAINLQGDTFSRASVEGLLEQIQSQLDRGGRLVFQ